MTAYRSDIDGLRALAILPVVLFHLGFPAFGGGYVGVDVFFVISGFLITSIVHPEILAGRFSFARFYERRIRRLFPALFAVLLASLAAALVILMPEDFKSFAKSIAAATLFAANLFFWRTAGYFDGPAESKPLLHTWSLSVEEQFYIVYPVVLLLLARRVSARALPAWLAGAAAVSFLASLAALARWPEAAFYLPIYRAWELLLGAWLALTPPRPLTRPLRSLLALTGLAMVGYAVLSFTPATPFPGANALFPALGTALVILAGAAGEHGPGRLLGWRPVVLIGLISYSLYLWHWPLIVFTRYVLMREPDTAERLALLAAALILATLSWRFVERPFRGKSGLLTRPTLFATAGLAMAGLIGFGLIGDQRVGFPERFPPEVAGLAAVAEERNPYRKPCVGRAPERIAADPACALGDAAEPPEFLLWGDSHALALAPALTAAADMTSRRGLFIGKNGCPPLLGVERLDSPHGCRPHNDRVRQWLLDHPEVRTVVLAGRWGLVANGQRHRTEGKKPAVIAPDGIAGNPAAFRDGLARTLAFLTQRGFRVIVVDQVPEIGWHVPVGLAIARQFGRPTPVVPTLADFRFRQAVVDAALTNLAERYRFERLDPGAPLCPNGTCRIELDGHPLYRDDNHLSLRGADILTPIVAARLGTDTVRHAKVSP
jgi:peptidoglycan/LPS O-acetylase OafA/YrhL